MSKTQEFKNGVLIYERDERTLDEAKNERIAIIKMLASQAINDAELDPVSQINAALNVYSVEKTEQIKAFIAAVRNEYLRCKDLIIAATTNDEVDLVSFSFVNPPTSPPLVTAEQAVSQYFSPYQTLALQRFEMALLQAGKPLGPKMSACKTWLEGVMLGWAMNPVAAPAASFGSPAATFEEASAEAVTDLAG